MSVESAFQTGVGIAEEAEQRKQKIADERRAYSDAMAQNEIANAPADKRAALMSDYLATQAPEKHGSIIARIAGLITGKQKHAPGETAPTPPPPSTAPSTAGWNLQSGLPAQPEQVQAAPTPTPAPEPTHPFAHNTVYQGILNRLKTFDHPVEQGPKQTPFIVRNAQYYKSPEEIKQGAETALENLKQKGRLEVAKARGANARPVADNRAAFALDDAISLQENSGRVFADSQGEEIDLGELKRAGVPLKLIPVLRPGQEPYYIVANQTDRIQVIGNQVVTLPELGTTTPAQEAALGAKNLGTSTTKTETSPSGEQVVAGTHAVSPRTGTVPTAQSGIPTGAPTAPVLHQRPSAPAVVIPPQTPTGVTPTHVLNHAIRPTGTGESQDILPNIQHMTSANARLATKAQPAVTALIGMFGDPRNPQVKSMADFASLSNDPHAQMVLGKAFQLLDQEMGEVNDSNMIATLGNLAGWGGFRADVASRIQREAGTAMTPQEKEYFDTAIASMADIIGSRSATGQSPARFSVKAMQNELPLIGTSSVTDESSYLTKMNTISRQIEVGLNAMPDNKRALNYLRKRQNDMIQQGNRASKKLNPVSSQAPDTSNIGKKAKSLAAAMALPINKGKSKDEVTADLKDRGYKVAP